LLRLSKRLPPFTDFNVLISQIIAECKEKAIKGITFREITQQTSIKKLGRITSKNGLKISKSKRKTMAFKGRDPVGSKIIINNNVIEQINTFHDLGYSISYQNEKCITVKISTFLQITGIINRN
jgi:hypothetical protein